VPEGDFGAEDTGVYYRRLIRDGWKLISQKEKSKWNSETIFQKAIPKGWVLRKIAHEQVDSPKGKGCYWDEHELINDESETKLTVKDWEWAELDGKSIVWACKGCIYRATIKSRTEIGEPKLLYDFNSLEFEEIRAPY
jgi:hypothetical protein